MDNNFSRSSLSPGEGDGVSWVRAPVWPAVLAILVVLGMLTAFYQVVREAVQQSELRHKALVMQAEASWRCNHLGGPQASDNCLSRLNAPTPDEPDPVLQSRNTKLADAL